MSAEHKTRRVALRGATAVLGGIAMVGAGAGMANASTTTAPDHQGQWGQWGQHDQWGHAGHGANGPRSSVVDLSHENIPIQACHNQVPVNVLGVQVPVQDVTGALGLGVLGSAGTAPAATDGSCHQAAASQD